MERITGRGRAAIDFAMVWLPPTIVAASAYLLWLAYHPGIMSYDSIAQYRQGVAEKYDNAHPPIMSIVLSAVFRLGGDIQHLVLIQCLTGLLGVYALAVAALHSAFGKRIGDSTARFSALLVTAALLTPISPLPHFIVTFWKDVWLMVAFCWLSVLWLQLTWNRDRIGRPVYAFGLIAFLMLSILAALVRHNSIVVLPVLSIMFSLLLQAKRVSWKIAAPALMLPSLLYIGVKDGIDWIFSVENIALEQVVYATDLTALCYYYPDMLDELPFTHAHLTPEFRDVYYVGHVDLYGRCLTLSFQDLISNGGAGSDAEQIRREYGSAVFHYPLRVADIKAKKFYCLVERNPSSLYSVDVHENEFGLKPNDRYAGVRLVLQKRLSVAFHHPTQQWVFCHHGPWLIANFVFVCANIVLWLRRRKAVHLNFAIVLLIPLSYVASFLLASVTSDFRYLYPSTLIVQVLTIAVVFGSIVIGVREGMQIFRWREVCRRVKLLKPTLRGRTM